MVYKTFSSMFLNVSKYRVKGWGTGSEINILIALYLINILKIIYVQKTFETTIKYLKRTVVNNNKSFVRSWYILYKIEI